MQAVTVAKEGRHRVPPDADHSEKFPEWIMQEGTAWLLTPEGPKLVEVGLEIVKRCKYLWIDSWIDKRVCAHFRSNSISSAGGPVYAQPIKPDPRATTSTGKRRSKYMEAVKRARHEEAVRQGKIKEPAQKAPKRRRSLELL